MSRLTILVAVSALAVGQAAQAQWVQWPSGDGHWYRLTNEQLGWNEAKVAAENLGGTLVVIDTGEENSFVSLTFALPGVPIWTGLFQNHANVDYSEPAGGWEWVDGTPVVYTNWAAGEPNQHQGSPQDFAQMNNADNVNGAGTWDDNQNAPTFFGVVERESIACGDGIVDVEFGEQCDDGNTSDEDFCLSDCTVNTSIPAVSTWGLVVLALLMLAAGTLVMMRRKSVVA